jgi:kinetochore protein Spc7/SPC105
MMPAVKSILSTVTAKQDQDDAAKRKAARRKSLANRRVSFAPEATLHTWDVVEYMRDATSSSTSSDEARRASSMTQASAFPSPGQDTASGVSNLEPDNSEDKEVEAEARNKTKRRRSSGIPPLNFNNPDDEFSSSPVSDESPLKLADSDTEEDEFGDATMDLDEDRTAQSIISSESGNTTSSSARLDARLRQATVHAKAQIAEADPDGDQTMEICEDEVTHAFRPWLNRRDSVGGRQLAILDDQENVDPFSSGNSHSQPTEVGDITEEISMDLTKAIGGIISSAAGDKSAEQVKHLKRTRSSTNIGAMADSSGSPIQRPTSRRSLRRQSLADESNFGDESMAMDFTEVVGGIREINGFPITNNKTHQASPTSSLGDATMDFTVAVGGIRQTRSEGTAPDTTVNTDVLEDMSMELTENLGKVLDETIPVTPSPVRRKQPSREPRIPSPLPPTVRVERGPSPRSSRSSSSPKLDGSVSKPKRTPKKSPRRTPRKSIMPSPLSQAPMTPDQFADPIEEELETIPETPVAPTPIAVSAQLEVPAPVHAPALQVAPKTSLNDTLRLLLTPRREFLPPPALAAPITLATPKRTSPRKVATPKRAETPKHRLGGGIKSASPRKRVRLDIENSPEKTATDESEISEGQYADPISLDEFLNLTNIRFMDLTTTKRRATGHPGAEGMFTRVTEDQLEEQETNMENSVAAAVSVVPMLSMYQHVSLLLSILLVYGSHVAVMRRDEIVHLERPNRGQKSRSRSHG